jgi:hypothetical protein
MEKKLENFFEDLCKLCKEHGGSITVKEGRLILDVTLSRDDKNKVMCSADFGVKIDAGGSIEKMSG